MRKLPLKAAIMMAIASASFAGHAADSASLSVIGSIEPSTCDVALSSTSVDFGKIPAASLTGPLNELRAADVTVSLNCDAPTAVAVQTVDNRSASAMTAADILADTGIVVSAANDQVLFGLGTDSANNKIGFFGMSIHSANVDGSSNPSVLSSTDKSSWTVKQVSEAEPLIVQKDAYFASGVDADATSPVAVTNASYTLASSIVLKQAGKYPTGETVNLDGNVTFSVVYL